MKQTLLIITALMLVVGCSLKMIPVIEEPVTKPIDGSILVWRDGGLYAPDSDKPYSGEAVWYYDNGQKKLEATYKNGKKDRKYTSWYENGQKWYEGYIETINDTTAVLNGLYTLWNENGQKEEEQTYKNGERDGKWIYWYENGQKMIERIFKYDVLTEETYWDRFGNVTDEYPYQPSWEMWER